MALGVMTQAPSRLPLRGMGDSTNSLSSVSGSNGGSSDSIPAIADDVEGVSVISVDVSGGFRLDDILGFAGGRGLRARLHVGHDQSRESDSASA